MRRFVTVHCIVRDDSKVTSKATPESMKSKLLLKSASHNTNYLSLDPGLDQLAPPFCNVGHYCEECHLTNGPEGLRALDGQSLLEEGGSIGPTYHENPNT